MTMKIKSEVEETIPPVPNARIEELAKREEARFNSLLLKHKDLLSDCIASGITHQFFQESLQSQIFSVIARYYDKNGSLLTYQAFESIVLQHCKDEEGVRFRSEYDSVYAEHVSPDDYKALKDNLMSRYLQRRAFHKVQNAFNDLLNATEGQKGIVENFQKDIASIRTGNGDYRFPLLRYDDLRLLKPEPDKTIAGDGWLRRGAGTLLTGGTGLGKSVLASQLSVCVAGGVDFFGVRVREPRRVLVLQSENDEETLKRDILSVRAGLKACPVLVHANLFILHVFGLHGEDFVSYAESQVAKLKPDLLVVDNYSSFVGPADLNSSQTVASFVQPMDDVIKGHDCGLLLVAHTPKPADREAWSARQSVYLAAGHSGLANWCRTSCELTECPKGDIRFRLRFGKNAERTGMANGTGQVVRDLYVEHSGDRTKPFWMLAEDQGEPHKSRFEDSIRKIVEENPELSVRAVASKVGCSKSTVQKLKTNMSNCSLGSGTGHPVSCPPLKGGWTVDTSSGGCPVDTQWTGVDSGHPEGKEAQNPSKAPLVEILDDGFLAED